MRLPPPCKSSPRPPLQRFAWRAQAAAAAAAADSGDSQTEREKVIIMNKWFTLRLPHVTEASPTRRLSAAPDGWMERATLSLSLLITLVVAAAAAVGHLRSSFSAFASQLAEQTF